MQAILQTFPLLRTSDDELALLDKRASVQSNLVSVFMEDFIGSVFA